MMPATASGALIQAARSIGVNPSWLAALVDFETAGTWDPQIRNPRSSARGLLQWIDATARELGYTDSRDLVERNPTVESQLRGPVVAYLSRFGPFPSLQSLALAVFYPAYRNLPPETEFPPHVQAVNPGVRTIADYVRHVSSRLGPLPFLTPTAAGGLPAWVWVSAGAALLLLLLAVVR